MRLLVVAGHGAGDPGAVGYGFNEAERVRALASRIKALGGASVILGDTSIDWYASGQFSRVDKSTFDAAIELHMDSATPTACGGHVIVKAGFAPDAYDNALARFIGGYFPGRSNLIVGRDDLANPNRCAARGINYRLLEVCFITNGADLDKFNNSLDTIAKGILAAFGIGAAVSNAVQKTASKVESKGEITMVCFYRITDYNKDKVYYFDGHNSYPLEHPDEKKVLNDIYKANNGKDMPEFKWVSTSPWFTRLCGALDKTAPKFFVK